MNGLAAVRETRINPSAHAGGLLVPLCDRPRVIFGAWVVAYLALVWSFRYLPTCDGPLHLASAVTWARFDEPHTRYREFYVFEPKQVPNLTSQIVLAGLVRFVHPLTAEKLLVSIYVVGLAIAFWFCVTAFGGDARWFTPLGLLFVFNRAFFFGLYNYCLSLIAFWYVAGYCLRRPSGLRIVDVLTLAGVLTLSYCTHLVGWVLSVIAAFWFTALPHGNRIRNLLYLAAGAAPASFLALGYGMETSMAAPDGVLPVLFHSLRGLSIANVEQRLATLCTNMFGPLAPSDIAFGWAVFVCGVIVAAAVLCLHRGDCAGGARRALALAALLSAAYFVFPDQVGRHGGLLVLRLAFLPPMLLVCLLRLPTARLGRCTVLAFLYALLLLDIASAVRFFTRANAEIEEYVAGGDAVGKSAAIFTAAPPDGSYWPGHLWHAAGYYCLTTGNIALDNFQGAPGPFWIHFRPGFAVCRGNFNDYLNKSDVDYVLVWHDRSYPVTAPPGCREVFSQDRLHVFADRADGVPRTRYRDGGRSR